jgi:F-type H+-transporting ATPase subunit alpha
MSITDGHILFSANLRAQGQYPAIEPERSVTRVGRQTQMFIHKVVSDKVRSLLSEFHELERFSKFGAELSAETQKKIKRGKVTEALIRQDQQTVIGPGVQIIMLTLVFTGYFDAADPEKVKTDRKALIAKISTTEPFITMSNGIKEFKFDELVTKLTEQVSHLEGVCLTPTS